MNIPITVLYVIMMSICSLVVLFLLAKLIGNKQMSEMNLFDYINGITIGSIAAEFATAETNEFVKPLTGMVVYGLATALISYLASKSPRVRILFSGRVRVLMDNGKIYRSQLKKARLDLDEFLAMLRVNGYFDLSQIETVLFEPNGRLSVLPKSMNRPQTPQDSNLPVSKESIFYNVIMDGRIMDDTLRSSGKDRNWLMNELKKMKYTDISQIFLASCDENNNLQVYKNE